MEKKRVGVIGSGMIGKQHVEALRRIPCVEVVSLAEMNEALGRKMAEELAIPTFYTDYKKMIENDAYCTDVLIQVSAITAALNSFNKILLSNHISTCVADNIKAGNMEVVDELVTTIQKLMK